MASSRPDPRNSDWDNVDYWNDRIKTVVGGSIPIKFEKVSLEEEDEKLNNSIMEEMKQKMKNKK